MRPTIEKMLGVACPKQYCPLFGRYSMLEHTVKRAAMLVGGERIVTVIGQGHRRYLQQRELRGHVIEQPAARGTTVGVFLPLSYIAVCDPEATVCVFPSDHFIFPNQEFVRRVSEACLLAETYPDQLVLCGVEPERPETDYGWIRPGERFKGWPSHGGASIRRVAGFREKPARPLAEEWFLQGYLWNTLIVVGKLETLWSLARRFVPRVLRCFEELSRSLRQRQRELWRIDPASDTLVSQIYAEMPVSNLSQDFLTRAVSRTLVMSLTDIVWSDWGRPERVLETIQRMGSKAKSSLILHPSAV